MAPAPEEIAKYPIGATVTVSRDFRVGRCREGGPATVIAFAHGLYSVKYVLTGGSEKQLREDELSSLNAEARREKKRAAPRNFLIPDMEATYKRRSTIGVVEAPQQEKRRKSDSSLTASRKSSVRPVVKTTMSELPRVVLTGLRKMDSLARQGLALCVVSEATRATHVVVDGRLRRTPKLMAGIAAGARFVLDVEWLRESARQGRLVEEEPFAARDEEREKLWNFSLENTLKKVSAKKFFKNFVFVSAGPNLPSHDDLEPIIRVAGGQFLATPKAALARRPDSDATLFVLVDKNGPTIQDIFLPVNASQRREAYVLNRLRELFPTGVAVLDAETFYEAVLNKTNSPLLLLLRHEDDINEHSVLSPPDTSGTHEQGTTCLPGQQAATRSSCLEERSPRRRKEQQKENAPTTLASKSRSSPPPKSRSSPPSKSLSSLRAEERHHKEDNIKDDDHDNDIMPPPPSSSPERDETSPPEDMPPSSSPERDGASNDMMPPPLSLAKEKKKPSVESRAYDDSDAETSLKMSQVGTSSFDARFEPTLDSCG